MAVFVGNTQVSAAVAAGADGTDGVAGGEVFGFRFAIVGFHSAVKRRAGLLERDSFREVFRSVAFVRISSGIVQIVMTIWRTARGRWMSASPP